MTMIDDRTLPGGADGAGGAGGQKINWAKLAPVLGAIASYAIGQKKGYGGLAAGEFMGSYTAAQQRAEEQKRYENQLKRQQWMDEMTRLEWERQRDALAKQQQLADWVISGLQPMAAGSPGSPGSPGGLEVVQTTPAPESGLTLTGEFATPQDTTFQLAQPPEFDIASTPATPATPETPSDPMAQYWIDAVKASGGDPKVVLAAMEYLHGKSQPQQPMPTRDVGLILESLSEDNPYRSALMQPDLDIKRFDALMDKAYEFEAERIKSPEELEKLRAEIDLVRARIAATNRSNQPRGKDEEPPSPWPKNDSERTEAQNVAYSLLGYYKTPARDAVADIKKYMPQLVRLLGKEGYQVLLAEAEAYEGAGSHFQPGVGSPIRQWLESLGIIKKKGKK